MGTDAHAGCNNMRLKEGQGALFLQAAGARFRRAAELRFPTPTGAGGECVAQPQHTTWKT